jgi:hypothetical protein
VLKDKIMPFIIQELESAFLSLLRDPPKSGRAAAKVIADAYARYARPAIGVGVPAIFTGTEASRMANAIAGSFNPKGNAGLASTGMANGVLAFWLTPPVAFGPNITVAFPGYGVLMACLSTLKSTKISENQAARKLARCLDSATKLVLVQPAVPGPPVPIA